jgi:serine/threonine protein kinase
VISPPKHNSTGIEPEGGNLIDSGGGNVKIGDFELTNHIGHGAVGHVWHAHKKDTKQEVAIKIIEKHKINHTRGVERVVAEREITAMCDHPFLVKLLFAFQDSTRIFFVLEYVGGGDFYRLLKSLPMKKMSEKAAQFYCAEIVLALEYLHNKDICFRDLKGENLLVDVEGHIKIADFGLATTTTEMIKDTAKKSVCGTPEYMAPEVIKESGHGKLVDFWALGILTYEMLTGATPWAHLNAAETFFHILRKKVPVLDEWSEATCDFILQLTAKKPKKRLGANGTPQVKSHPFFDGVDWAAVEARSLKAPFVPPQQNLSKQTAATKKTMAEFKDLFKPFTSPCHSPVSSPVSKGRSPISSSVASSATSSEHSPLSILHDISGQRKLKSPKSPNFLVTSPGTQNGQIGRSVCRSVGSSYHSLVTPPGTQNGQIGRSVCRSAGSSYRPLGARKKGFEHTRVGAGTPPGRNFRAMSGNGNEAGMVGTGAEAFDNSTKCNNIALALQGKKGITRSQSVLSTPNACTTPSAKHHPPAPSTAPARMKGAPADGRHFSSEEKQKEESKEVTAVDPSSTPSTMASMASPTQVSMPSPDRSGGAELETSYLETSSPPCGMDSTKSASEQETSSLSSLEIPLRTGGQATSLSPESPSCTGGQAASLSPESPSWSMMDSMKSSRGPANPSISSMGIGGPAFTSSAQSPCSSQRPEIFDFPNPSRKAQLATKKILGAVFGSARGLSGFSARGLSSRNQALTQSDTPQMFVRARKFESPGGTPPTSTRVFDSLDNSGGKVGSTPGDGPTADSDSGGNGGSSNKAKTSGNGGSLETMENANDRHRENLELSCSVADYQQRQREQRRKRREQQREVAAATESPQANLRTPAALLSTQVAKHISPDATSGPSEKTKFPNKKNSPSDSFQFVQREPLAFPWQHGSSSTTNIGEASSERQLPMIAAAVPLSPPRQGSVKSKQPAHVLTALVQDSTALVQDSTALVQKSTALVQKSTALVQKSKHPVVVASTIEVPPPPVPGTAFEIALHKKLSIVAERQNQREMNDKALQAAEMSDSIDTARTDSSTCTQDTAYSLGSSWPSSLCRGESDRSLGGFDGFNDQGVHTDDETNSGEGSGEILDGPSAEALRVPPPQYQQDQPLPCLHEREERLTDEESRLADKESRLTDEESRLADEESRLADEESRLTDEESRLTDEESRLADEESRLTDEESRLTDEESYYYDSADDTGCSDNYDSEASPFASPFTSPSNPCAPTRQLNLRPSHPMRCMSMPQMAENSIIPPLAIPQDRVFSSQSAQYQGQSAQYQYTTQGQYSGAILRHRPPHRPRTLASAGLENAFRCAVDLGDKFESRQGMAKVVLGGDGSMAKANDWSIVFSDPFLVSMMGWQAGADDNAIGTRSRDEEQADQDKRQPAEENRRQWADDVHLHQADAKDAKDERGAGGLMPETKKWEREHKGSGSASKNSEERRTAEHEAEYSERRTAEHEAAEDKLVNGEVVGCPSNRNTAEYTPRTAYVDHAAAGGKPGWTAKTMPGGMVASVEQLAMDEDGQQQILQALTSIVEPAKSGSAVGEHKDGHGGQRTKEVCVWMRLAKGRRARVRIQLRLALYPTLYPALGPSDGGRRWEDAEAYLIPVVLWHQHEVLPIMASA